jgi:DNA-damage-inducible protein D
LGWRSSIRSAGNGRGTGSAALWLDLRKSDSYRRSKEILADSHLRLEQDMAKNSNNLPATDGSLINRLLAEFERAKHVDENGREYWLAREYCRILGYTWEGFEGVIKRGKAALEARDGQLDDHFRHVSKSIPVPKGGKRDIGDIELTRRACYLVGINGDPRKKEAIAAVQRYFTEQTRKQEILEQVTADADRLNVCEKLADNRAELRLEAGVRGVDDHGFKTVVNAGNKALFGQSPSQTKKDLGVPKGREIEEFADPVAVAAMGLGTAMTTHQTRAKDLKGTAAIADENKENHASVRNLLTDRKIFPEKLPPAGDIKKVEERVDKQRKKLAKRNSQD